MTRTAAASAPRDRHRSNLRILVEPSDYIIRNIGDTAMMMVALERLAALWPEARIQVLTDEPELLPRPAANVEPLHLNGRRVWLQQTWRLERSSRPPPSATRFLRRIRVSLRRSRPGLAYRLLRRWGRLTAAQDAELAGFFDALSRADLLVATGMGGITSAFPDYASELLDVLRSAQRLGVRTAMLGQGLGPLESARLRRRTAAVLRRLDLLTLREKRAGLPLLKALSVPLDRVIVTGGDAIEFASRHTPHEAADAIGVNLRFANYAGTRSDDFDRIRPVLQRLRIRLAAPLVGVPISRVPGEEDARSIADLIGGAADLEAALSAMRTPEAIVAALARCRVLVAGSYHAGVFALALGIPTVALVRSAYYVDKFSGLQDMFGTGCTTVRLDEPDFADHLEQAVAAGWEVGEDVRAALRAAGQEQLGRSRAAYAKLPELLI